MQIRDSTQTALQITFLGKPALYVNGRLQLFGGPRKAISLLAYVLLHGDRVLSRAAIAEQFWPDEEDENARTALRRHLHRALSRLPETSPERPWIIADKTTLRWNSDAPATIDTAEYDRLTVAGELARAVTLYRGDYLEDFYDDWILPERERLRERHCANLIALVDERRRELDYAGAIAFAQTLLRLDPLREDAIRRSMSLRFAVGDRSGALSDYDSFRQRLREELSVEPMQETIALYEAIHANELAPTTGGHRRRVAQSTLRPGFAFVGRVSATKALRDAWDEAARGNGSTVIVSGEAGIGKSRLIGELIALAETQGGRVALGTTAGIESEPYQPIAEALNGALRLLRFERFDRATVAALSALLPGVREFAPDVADLAPLDFERDKRRLFDAIVCALEQLAEKRPLLVVFEDLHWAGSATIELLAVLVRRLRDRSVLLIVSFREEEVSGNHAIRPLLRRLDVGSSSHVALGPLTENDVRALVSGALADESDALATDVFAASEGNALYVTELLRHRLTGETTIPTGIAAMVTASTGRLSPPARSLLETAAVIGAGFDADVLRQACGWTFAQTHDALGELLDRGLVRERLQRRGDFSFSHQIVHAAIYAELESDVRVRLHRRIAKTIEAMFDERPSMRATIARHFDAAGFASDAVPQYLHAVRHALDVSAQSEAIELATRALELCTDTREEFELHRLRAAAAAQSGDNATRREDCTAMLRVARELEDHELIATALRQKIALFMSLGLRDDEATTIEELRLLGERIRAPRWTVEAAFARARLEINLANPDAASARLIDIEPLLALVDDAEVTFEYWYVRAFISASSSAEDARAHLERARAHAHDHPRRTVRALRVEAHMLIQTGDARALHPIATKLLEAYLEIGDLEGQASAHHSLAICAWMRFELEDLREHLRSALALFERVEKPNTVAAELINHGIFATNTGAFDDAERYFHRALAIYEDLGQNDGTCLAMAKLAELELFRDNHAPALELAIATLARTRRLGCVAEEHLALKIAGIAECRLGNFPTAQRHFATVLTYLELRGRVDRIDTLVETIPAHLGASAVDDALAAAEELLRELDSDRMLATFPARALASAAAAFAAAGDVVRATTLHAEARTLLRELAGRVSDEPMRNGYLALPGHRELAHGLTLPMRDAAASANQSAPSGPAAMP